MTTHMNRERARNMHRKLQQDGRKGRKVDKENGHEARRLGLGSDGRSKVMMVRGGHVRDSVF